MRKKPQEMSEVSKKTITGGKNVQSNKKEMTWTSEGNDEDSKGYLEADDKVAKYDEVRP